MAKYVHIKKYIKQSSQTHQKHITTHQILKHIKLYIKSTCAHQTGTSNILMCFWCALMCTSNFLLCFWCALMCTSKFQNLSIRMSQSTSNEFDVVHQMYSTSKVHHRCTSFGTSNAQQKSTTKDACTSCIIWCTIWCTLMCKLQVFTGVNVHWGVRRCAPLGALRAPYIQKTSSRGRGVYRIRGVYRTRGVYRARRACLT